MQGHLSMHIITRVKTGSEGGSKYCCKKVNQRVIQKMIKKIKITKNRCWTYQNKLYHFCNYSNFHYKKILGILENEKKEGLLYPSNCMHTNMTLHGHGLGGQLLNFLCDLEQCLPIPWHIHLSMARTFYVVSAFSVTVSKDIADYA